MLIQIASFIANAEAQGMVLIRLIISAFPCFIALMLPTLLLAAHVLSTQQDHLTPSTWFPALQLRGLKVSWLGSSTARCIPCLQRVQFSPSAWWSGHKGPQDGLMHFREWTSWTQADPWVSGSRPWNIPFRRCSCKSGNGITSLNGIKHMKLLLWFWVNVSAHYLISGMSFIAVCLRLTTGSQRSQRPSDTRAYHTWLPVHLPCL